MCIYYQLPIFSLASLNHYQRLRGPKKPHCDSPLIQVAEELQNAGAAAVTIHGRTMEQRYKRAADWGLVQQAAHALTVPIIGNGDVLTHYEVQQLPDINTLYKDIFSARTKRLGTNHCILTTQEFQISRQYDVRTRLLIAAAVIIKRTYYTNLFLFVLFAACMVTLKTGQKGLVLHTTGTAEKCDYVHYHYEIF